MLLSVIVPVYDVEEYLAECIESVLSQGFKSFELILVDDGSPDLCGKICDDYANKDTRIKVYHQENKGVSWARNKGLENARGDYVCFIDADDYILEGYFDCINLYAAYDVLKFGGDGSRIVREYIEFEDFVPSINYSGTVWSYAIKRELIEKYKIRFPIGVTHSEDNCFMLKLLSVSNSILVIGKNYYYYRNRSNSVIHQKVTHKASDSHLMALVDILSFYVHNEIERPYLYSRALEELQFYFVVLLKIPLNEFSIRHACKSFEKFMMDVEFAHQYISNNFYVRHYSSFFLCMFKSIVSRMFWNMKKVLFHVNKDDINSFLLCF